MDKDAEIKKLRAEIARLKKKKVPETYVTKNIKKFDDLKDFLHQFKVDGKEDCRYFHKRKNKGKRSMHEVFKLNILIDDLIEFKARKNVKDDQLSVRISMDKGSLIRHLQEGRVQRPRIGGGKKN